MDEYSSTCKTDINQNSPMAQWFSSASRETSVNAHPVTTKVLLKSQLEGQGRDFNFSTIQINTGVVLFTEVWISLSTQMELT